MSELRSVGRSTPAPDVSVVIPVYNEEGNLRQLQSRLTEVFSKLGKTYEIIYVDDGSADQSVPMLLEMSQRDPHVVLVELARNYGQHSAVFAGFENARGDVVVTLDADLQNPPEEIPKLLAKIDEGYDVVGGWRQQRKDSFLRTLPSKVVNKFTSRMMGCNMKDYGCMLRAYRQEIVQRMTQFREHSSFIPALATSVGGKVIEVEVNHSERNAGTSKYNLLKLIKLNYDLVTSFSTFPLQLLSIIGFVMSFLGIGFGAFLAVRRLIVGPEVEGVFTLFAILFFFVGTLYMALGLLGEYVGRIYQEVRKRPRFIIARIVKAPEAAASRSDRSVEAENVQL